MIVYCQVCKQRILSHSRTALCVICNGKCHTKCISLKDEELSSILSDDNRWYCMTCMSSTLPFNHIQNDPEFQNALQVKDDFEVYRDSLSEKIFNPFTLKDKDISLPLDDLDSDCNVYNDVAFHYCTLCKYYTENIFNTEIASAFKNVPHLLLSLCHINMRSLQSNLDSFTAYLQSLEFELMILGVTETWLQDLYNLHGYSLTENHRSKRSGGRVGIYLKNEVEFVVRDDLAIFNDLLESVFIEIPKDVFKMDKNMIIGVVYRPPGGDLSLFNAFFADILQTIQTEN